MNIGIIGSGFIGGTLAKLLSTAGHKVRVSNSRGPNTIDADVLSTGAIPVTKEEALVDADVIILSIPFVRIPDLKKLLAGLPEDVVIIDTSNYIPARDERLDAIENGQPDSMWASEQIGRPLAKAWNTIYSASLNEAGRPAGDPERIAVPVAADRDQDRIVAMALIEDSGFDAYYAGSLAESWRQQCGTPCYCTELTSEALPQALADADLARSRKRQDLFFAVYNERFGTIGTNPSRSYIVQLSKLIYA
ncbi:NAD(P)-binding domain-containing protein [Pseudomonas sp. ITEM 17296]|jgi:predicted dinucleotide-binding enzyme|uniref:NADPH-dependent F420 reductase n=1 Tax=Pseudomonas sp. ITEM 17296 TaxID=2790281 RepID=UPI00235C47FB|nr:NAD(P)-binding domain-containing protein [Pseudomonas sp. ITEM 17296]MDE4540207.1 NAD(P)-binding domain-containing protein [Pseudomonas sp. ITEM 17296]GLO54894.1 3-hydroxyisobutyrate dehydrogenase [Pseudomonas putida]